MLKIKLSKYKKVEAYILYNIQSQGYANTYDIESFGRTIGIMSSTALRYARVLLEKRVIKKGDDNYHSHKYILNQGV